MRRSPRHNSSSRHIFFLQTRTPLNTHKLPGPGHLRVHIFSGCLQRFDRDVGSHVFSHKTYGVASISRLLKITGLFCKRALKKRRYSARETYNFKEPTNRSDPIAHEPTNSHSGQKKTSCLLSPTKTESARILTNPTTFARALRFESLYQPC